MAGAYGANAEAHQCRKLQGLFCKFQAVPICLLVFVTLWIAAPTALADVTGFFEITTIVVPQTNSFGTTVVQVDFQNNLTVTIQLGFFGWTFHGHGGITGLEDIITSSFVALGPLRVEPQLVMAQAFQQIFASSGLAIPVCLPNGTTGQCDFLFVSYRLQNSLSLAGVTVRNLAIYEDTSFPDPTLAKPVGAAYGAQSQSFAFGDVVSFEGVTRGGITIKGATGICAADIPKKIKKHELDYSVNPHCVPGASGSLPFFFDFESLSITGVPLVPGVLVGTSVECVTIFACTITNTINVNAGPVPFSAIVVFDDLLTLTIDSVTVALTQGAGTLTVQIGTGGAVSLSTINLAFLLNPSTLPGMLNLTISGAPGVGITDFIASLSVTRSGLTATAIASFTGSLGDFDFSRLLVVTSAQAGIVRVEGRISFGVSGLEHLNLAARVSF